MVDPNNLIDERNETNNIAEKNLTVSTLPDLLPHISFAPKYPEENSIATITATVYNQGERDTSGVVVSLYEGATHLMDFTLDIPGGASRKAHLIYGPFPEG
ncbi:MAG: CARDB domain-containing protein, partial [bacterium]